MNATVIDGRGIADAVLNNLRQEIEALGEPLHLAAVCIGEDSALRSFVKIKQKAAQSVGLVFSSYMFGSGEKDDALRTLKYLAADDEVHGIFVELPLPVGWDRDEILNLIPASKDVDAISPAGERDYYADRNPVLPPAVRALELALQEYDLDVRGLNAAVIGAGRLVGRPVAHWLERHGAHVALADAETAEPGKISARSDIVVACAGVAGLVKADWIKDGAIIIDFGYNRDADGNTVGDVAFPEVSKKAGFISPVPGGMGPLVVAAVLENLLTLASE